MHLGSCFPLPLWLLGRIWDSFLGLFVLVFFSPGPIQAKSPAPFTQRRLFDSPATSRGRSNPPALGDCGRPQHHLQLLITSHRCLAPNQLPWLGADPGCRRGCCASAPSLRSGPCGAVRWPRGQPALREAPGRASCSPAPASFLHGTVTSAGRCQALLFPGHSILQRAGTSPRRGAAPAGSILW